MTHIMRDPLTERIIGATIEVHRALGPGLLESAYEACLMYELHEWGLAVARQVEVPVVYKGVRLGCGFRIDLLVEAAVVVELKVVERIVGVHEAQLLSHMKLSNMKRGLILNFHAELWKDGIVRRVL